MKLRFSVDQASCLRRGIDCPKSIVTIEVNPADLPQGDRNLIADRLSGIDVLQLIPELGSDRVLTRGNYNIEVRSEIGKLVVADGPTYPELMEAILKEEERINVGLIDQLAR